MPKNYGLVLEDARRAKDWHFGGVSGMAKDSLQPDRDWSPFLPVYEAQSFPGYDSMSCVTYSALNCVETVANRRHGIVLNKSDRFSAKMSGTTSSGNNFWNVAESITKLHGVLDQAKWPNAASSFAEFFAEVPVVLVKEAEAWFAGDLVIQREYVHDDVESLWEALQHGPIQVAVHAYGPLVEGVYQRTEAPGNHAVMLYKAKRGEYWMIYDHYTNLYKRLAWNTRFWGAMRYDVVKKAAPPPTTIPMYEFKENYRYFLADAGGHTLLQAAGMLRLDDLAKITDQWLGRNDGDVVGKNDTITLKELEGVQLYNLKGEPVTLDGSLGNTHMPTLLTTVLESLRGKKTYLAAGAMGLFAVLGFFLGYLEPAKSGEIILEALAVAGLRAGINK